jgi:glycosyltransferase involved in cell wall biosynthesis
MHRLPIAAAVDATPAYRALLDEQLKAHWDVIVLDSYASGWALARCREYRAARNADVALVHVSHNHEAVVWQEMAQHSSASALHRWLIKRNAAKVAQLERELVANVDLFTAITDEDAEAIGKHNATPHLTLLPGFDGAVAEPRTIDASTPRRVIVVGSFAWVVKRENLARFVRHADPIFANENIELVIVGEVPDELLRELRAECRATTFAGFVEDLRPLLASSRIAIVPELIGGGFKLKFLDYFFGRVPVATVSAAASGVPGVLREQLLMGNDIAALTSSIVSNIDNVESLNHRQRSTFEQAATLFRWADRGERLRSAITSLKSTTSIGETRDAQRSRAVGS